MLPWKPLFRCWGCDEWQRGRATLWTTPLCIFCFCLGPCSITCHGTLIWLPLSDRTHSHTEKDWNALLLSHILSSLFSSCVHCVWVGPWLDWEPRWGISQQTHRSGEISTSRSSPAETPWRLRGSCSGLPLLNLPFNSCFIWSGFSVFFQLSLKHS